MRKFYPMIAVLFGFAAGGCATETAASIKSTFDSGVAAYDARDYAKAYQIWSSIDDEDVAAMRNVAMMRRQGLGTPKDPKGAEEMFARVLETGLPLPAIVDSEADLAHMLIKGEAGSPDPQRALPFVISAATAGNPIAEYDLAEFYETGELVPKDMTVARRLYAAAASHGMKEAQTRLDQLGPP